METEAHHYLPHEIDLTITAADQYVTAWHNGKPIATLVRRRVYEVGPQWRVYRTDGSLMFHSHVTAVESMKRRIARHLNGTFPNLPKQGA